MGRNTQHSKVVSMSATKESPYSCGCCSLLYSHVSLVLLHLNPLLFFGSC